MPKKKAPSKKDLLLVFGLGFILCLGIVRSSCTHGDQARVKTFPFAQTVTPIRQAGDEKKTDISYSAFSEPDVYFTFEYPANWTYKKADDAVWEFYANSEAQKAVMTLLYPADDAGTDPCLGSKDSAGFQTESIDVGDPKFAARYAACDGSAESSVYLEKNASQEAARLTWQSIDSDTASHIAHSIRIAE